MLIWLRASFKHDKATAGDPAMCDSKPAGPFVVGGDRLDIYGASRFASMTILLSSTPVSVALAKSGEVRI
jgi:hypothetical protein